jgi:uncharacterized protein (TIGR01777 family)
MHIVIAGASGFVGSHLVPYLRGTGHVVQTLVRRVPQAGEIPWSPEQGTLDGTLLEGVDAVINLSGENIATRWTDDAKRKILDSRITATTLLAGTIAGLKRKPSVFISVSAIGYYGDKGDVTVDETGAKGKGFLPDVAAAWEDATEPASRAGIRVVHPRLGIILSPDGGALQKMLLPFRAGVGGKLGSGKQWMSWIALDDVLGALLYTLTQPEIRGPVNFVAPEAVRNSEFTTTLGGVLSRPTLIPVPTFALSLLYGREMAEATLLTGAHVLPSVLMRTGYQFQFASLEPALRRMLE